MLLRVVVVALILPGCLIPFPMDAQRVGTYQFRVCTNECTAKDSLDIVARGEFVLFPNSDFSKEIPDSVLTRLHHNGRERMGIGNEFNACFRILSKGPSERSGDYLIGIIDESLSWWGVFEGEFHLTVYRSPDAIFTLNGLAEGDLIRGRGEQGHGADPMPPPPGFLAERIGPPDSNHCTGISGGG